MKNVQILNFLLVKISEKIFRPENFNYKRSLFFELPGLNKLRAQNAHKFLNWQRKAPETHPIFQTGTFSLVKKEKTIRPTSAIFQSNRKKMKKSE